MNTPPLPREFGSTWDNFQRDWYLGARLPADPTEIASALSTLERLWPDKVVRLCKSTQRGAGVLAGPLEIGRLLELCEYAHGFDSVLARIVNGGRSAYSEMVLVGTLRQLGYEANFAPAFGGHVLDAECSVDGTRVLFEVVAPESADVSEEWQEKVDDLRAVIGRNVSKCRVEIEVFKPITDRNIQEIFECIKSSESSEWSFVGSLARVRRINQGQPLLPLFDGDGTHITVMGEKDYQGESTSVIARREESDVRAKRVFRQKYRQLSDGVANVLVVNVSSVSDGMKTWPELIAGILRPDQNRKVGAVALFDQAVVGPPEAIRRRWQLVVNPHAHVKIPEVLLDGLESMDDSSNWGLRHLERVVAP